jgi:hypothetical protein
VIFAIVFEKFLFDQLEKRLFKWRPPLEAAAAPKEQ